MPSHIGRGDTRILLSLAGILAGMVLPHPGKMAHPTFLKAHPFVEGFHTKKTGCMRAAFSCSPHRRHRDFPHARRIGGDYTPLLLPLFTVLIYGTSCTAVCS